MFACIWQVIACSLDFPRRLRGIGRNDRPCNFDHEAAQHDAPAGGTSRTCVRPDSHELSLWMVGVRHRRAGPLLLQVRSACCTVSVSLPALCSVERGLRLPSTGGLSSHFTLANAGTTSVCSVDVLPHLTPPSLPRHRLVQAQQPWQTAESDCVAQGGHLASVWNEQERDLIYTLCSCVRQCPGWRRHFVTSPLRRVTSTLRPCHAQGFSKQSVLDWRQ